MALLNWIASHPYLIAYIIIAAIFVLAMCRAAGRCAEFHAKMCAKTEEKIKKFWKDKGY